MPTSFDGRWLDYFHAGRRATDVDTPYGPAARASTMPPFLDDAERLAVSIAPIA